jgi:hypothetical protein
MKIPKHKRKLHGSTDPLKNKPLPLFTSLVGARLALAGGIEGIKLHLTSRARFL